MPTPFVRSAVVVHFHPDGHTTTEALPGYDREAPRGRGSALSRDASKWTLRCARGSGVSAEVYIRRHRASNRKKKNGWWKDFPRNVEKAMREGVDVLELPKFGRWR